MLIRWICLTGVMSRARCLRYDHSYNPDVSRCSSSQAEWETYATKLANAPLESIGHVYDELVKEIDVKMTNPARVVFARDTRASGSRLVGVLNAALTATEVEFVDEKFMTTPQLHYVVRCKNTLGTQYEYGDPTERGYYEKLTAAFKKVMRGVKVQGSLTVDCANGVGGPKLRELIKHLELALDIKVVNDDVINPDSLNFEVSWMPLRPGANADLLSSVVPTMSRPSNVLRLPPRLPRLIDALRWTVTPTVWSTILSTRAISSDCWTAIASPLWLLLSLVTLLGAPASPRN